MFDEILGKEGTKGIVKLTEILAISTFDKVSLQKLADYAKRLTSGLSIYKRFSQRENAGYTRGGQILAESTLVIGASEGTDTGSKGKSLDQRNASQEKLIKAYAEAKGIWIPNSRKYLKNKYGDKVGSGKESDVWFDPAKKEVVKSQNTGQYRTLQEKLDSIVLYNSLFPDTALEVIGFGSDKESGSQVIVRQSFIKEAGNKDKNPSKEQMEALAQSMRFEPTKNEEVLSNFQNNQTLLRDLHSANGVLVNGKIAVIDAILRLNTPDLNYGGDRII